MKQYSVKHAGRADSDLSASFCIMWMDTGKTNISAFWISTVTNVTVIQFVPALHLSFNNDMMSREHDTLTMLLNNTV